MKTEDGKQVPAFPRPLIAKALDRLPLGGRMAGAMHLPWYSRPEADQLMERALPDANLRDFMKNTVWQEKRAEMARTLRRLGGAGQAAKENQQEEDEPRCGTSAKPLPCSPRASHGRGSDPHSDRQGLVLRKGTEPARHSTSHGLMVAAARCPDGGAILPPNMRTGCDCENPTIPTAPSGALLQ